jgi:membrane associated rhomboid family serine protease
MIPLQDSQPSGRFPLITILLIALNIYVFYLEMTAPDLDAFINQYALIPAAIDPNVPTSLATFLTSIFLHGGIFHILSNVWFLWIFGDNVEERFGWFFLPFYLLGGLAGSVAQYVIAPESTIPIVGASGAIAAVMGAYLVMFPHHTVKTIVPIVIFLTIVELPAIVMLAYWFFVQIFSGYAAIAETTATSGGVAYFAHIGGFIIGFLFAAFAGGRKH